MAGNKGLALIFGSPKRKPGEEPDEEEERDGYDSEDEESESEDSDKIHEIAEKMLDAFKKDDVDILAEALEDWKSLDEEWDRDEEA